MSRWRNTRQPGRWDEGVVSEVVQPPPATRRRQTMTAVIGGIVLVASLPGLALAVAPGNDLPTGAIAKSALPVTIDQDTTEATVSTDDVGCGAGGEDQATVWYTLTLATTTAVLVNANDSDYSVGVNVFEGTADADHLVDCVEGAVGFEASGGTTYYLMFADIDGGSNGGQLHVEIGLAPPPIEVQLTVDPSAKVNSKTGEATMSGTVTCSHDADFADVEITLREPIGRFTVHGSSFASPSCGPSATAWFASIVGDNGKFGPGRASADVSVFACDAFSCDDDAASVNLRLRK